MQEVKLLNNLPQIYRNADWLKAIYGASGKDLDDINSIIDTAEAQLNFSTSTWGLPFWENELGIRPSKNTDIDTRRSFVSAKWKGDQKTDLNLMQAVCNSWKNGDVEVVFINGKIQLIFIGEYGIPKDLDSLLTAIDDVKPAHLGVTTKFKYLLIKDINNLKTLNQIEQIKIVDFAG